MREDGLDPIEFLLGTWRGRGTGTWPTAGSFDYEEEAAFELGGGGADFPFLAYRERAWDPATDTTMHLERGCWRVHDGGLVDVTLAHPIGVTEIAQGSVDGPEITLTSIRIGVATRGLPVTGLRRRYRLDGDELVYEIDLSTGDVPLLRHLAGRLRRC